MNKTASKTAKAAAMGAALSLLASGCIIERDAQVVRPAQGGQPAQVVTTTRIEPAIVVPPLVVEPFLGPIWIRGGPGPGPHRFYKR